MNRKTIRPGHLFVIRGDVRQLACDCWLMPTRDAGAGEPLPTEGNGQQAWPCPWPISVPDTSWKGQVSAIKDALLSARRWLRTKPRRWRRCCPLLALSLGALHPQASAEGLASLVALLARAVQRLGCDIALVTSDEPSFLAAQAARRQLDPGSIWRDLSPALRDHSQNLARRVVREELALFLGAGVSAGAGLPLWGELLQKLADLAGMKPDEKGALSRLHELDQAELLARRLGGEAALKQALSGLFTTRLQALPHVLLAALPIREAVTTNYDQLFENALVALGRCPLVLPYDRGPATGSWLLKLHGCVSHPEDIILTRGDQLSYGDQFAALAGIVQALLITRHMLFVGFSLNDDNFHRIANAVRKVVGRMARCEGPSSRFGTALVLEHNPLIEELWGNELHWVTMADPADTPGKREPLEQARRLEIFLDHLLARTTEEVSLDLVPARESSSASPGRAPSVAR